MSIIQDALTRFAAACAAEREQQRRGYNLRLAALEAWAADDGTYTNILGEIAGVPVGVVVALPSAEFTAATRAWIEQAMLEAAHTIEAGYRPGAVRLATVRGVAA